MLNRVLLDAARHALNMVKNTKLKACPGGYKDTYEIAAVLDKVAEADLWYIAFTDDNGDNRDLFVMAADAIAAEKKWLAYYELDATDVYKVRVQNVSQSLLDAKGVVVWNLQESIV